MLKVLKTYEIDEIDTSSQMSKLIQNGESSLKEAIANGLDVKTLKNKLGMTLLHAASASPNEHAESIVKHILDTHLLNVNEKCKVSIFERIESRMDHSLFTSLSTIRMIVLLNSFWRLDLRLEYRIM